MRVKNAYFSLVSLKSEALTLEQSIPHFDNTAPLSFAVMHYINSGQYGGTSLYRHTSTGFENITEARYSSYQTRLIEDLRTTR